MTSAELARKYGLVRSSDAKTVLLVMDGVGGLAHPDTGVTELESANTPNMDALAKGGAIGLIDPIRRGIVPGSGLAHLSLFGYNAFDYPIGRGAIAAGGIGFEMEEGDIAVRVNFCTADDSGIITDRRAGRISSEASEKLCQELSVITLSDGVEFFIRPVREHRAVVIFRKKGLTDQARDTDPNAVGLKPKPLWLETDGPISTIAKAAQEFQDQAQSILRDHEPANMVLMRGFAPRPQVPSMNECYGLNPACIAVYPDYKGIAKIVGMEIKTVDGESVSDEFDTLEKAWDDHDFFFLHIKKTDSYGEDGNFDAKVGVIEEVDREISRVAALAPSILVITGDHSTPAKLSAHSAHPVPILYSGDAVRTDAATEFGESACLRGGLGRFPGSDIMLEALSYTGKVDKFGA